MGLCDAFSSPHVKGYSLILMIEMNICYHYGEVYWKTACLTVNAGLLGDEQSGTDYGAVAKAIGDMRGLVLPPNINLSDKGFTPFEAENKILFGLKPIANIGTDTLDEIIENRPFNSFGDFYERMIKSGKISDGKALTLIKSGCFDVFQPDRKQLMLDFVRINTPKKLKLTTVQLDFLSDHIDKIKFEKEYNIWLFRKAVFSRNKIPMNKEIEKEFINKYSMDVSYSFENGVLLVDEKSFDKLFKKVIEPLKKWLNEPETIDLYNKLKMMEFWKDNCMGTIESWEMESNLFYSKNHELELMPLKNYFDLANFNELSNEPIVIKYNNYKNRKIPQYKIEVIAGTVVDKIKQKNLISILTPNSGVVTLRIPKDLYAHYDQKVVRIDGKNKTVLDDSWFKRGTHLICVGFRRESEFILRKNGSQFSSFLMRVNGYNTEKLNIQMDKVAN